MISIGDPALAGLEAMDSDIAISQSRGKQFEGKHVKGAAQHGDSVSISEAARDKHAQSAAPGAEKAADEQQPAKEAKNETQAIKAAIAQIAQESGTPMRGWAVGHYRKAFAENSEDLSALKAIFAARHGLQIPSETKDPLDPDPITDPNPIDPSDVPPTNEEDPTAGLDPNTEDPGAEDPLPDNGLGDPAEAARNQIIQDLIA